MLLRLVPPPPQSGILYDLAFPCVLPLESLGPGATVPAAWSSQLQILTSFLQFDPPSSIHMLDRAVGLVARTREVSMDVPQKEILVKFVDGRVVNIPMNSDCVRILLGAALDIKGCNELEGRCNSMEGSTYPGIVGSTEDSSSPSSPTKSPKPGKHKRQRSLLFSLISSLVPKSLSSSSSLSPPPSAPPPTPLPPLPAASRVTSPIFPHRASLTSDLVAADFLRQRARAALVDVWRRHVITALTPLHLPIAGYAEWILIGMAGKVRAELESIKATKPWSHSISLSSKRTGGGGHRRAQSEARNALDFGDRSDEYGPERCRAPSPLPSIWDTEDIDRVVYPRRGQADEWGVRYVDYSTASDGVDLFELEFNGHNDSLLAEHFTPGDEWDDNEQLTFEISRMGCHVAETNVYSSGFGDRHLHTPNSGFDYNDDHCNRLADTAFDMSRTPLVPSDVNDGEESDEMSLQTLDEGEELPLALTLHTLRSSAQPTTDPIPQSSSVSRVTSSRPRSRNATAPRQASRPPTSLAPSSFGIHNADPRDAQVNEIIYSHREQLDRICTALEIVRSRAHEEGWRLVKAMPIGAKNGWMDDETGRALEIKAKRRAWSSGIKIRAPYTFISRSLKTRGSGLTTLRSPMSPPGLISRAPQAHGLIVPTGLSLGIPLRSSPLALYVCGVDSGRTSAPGILNTLRSVETVERKRSSRVTFADNVTKLFPVCEDESEDLFEPALVGFPQPIPPVPSVNESEVMESPANTEDDPFCYYPPQTRTRTTSMYVIPPTPSSSPQSACPVFRPSTPPPSYQAAIGGNIPVASNDEEMKLDTSALLLQPLSSSGPQPNSNPPFMPRPRAVSLPTIRPCPNTNKTRRTSLRRGGECYEDLSRTYASPPPEGPLVISAAPAPHEDYPRYAHMPLPISSGKKCINASILGRTGKEVVFEQGGSEFTVGIEVALGRAEEGRVIW